MPTYPARGVSIRLGVTPLAATITPNIVLRKGNDARKQVEEAEEQLLNSQFLNEKRIAFPGDERSFELNWLGDAPFMQSEVGRDLFPRHGKNQSKHAYSTKDAPHATDPDPLALSLHVITSHRTFVSGMHDSTKLHIKIEVFLNGRLSNCLFFPPYEYRSGAKHFHQVFGGHRVDFLAERPWVILPPDTAADGTRRRTPSASSVEQRWQEIAQALRIEAGHRGSNKDSLIPPTAEFLKALAAMDMPDQVRDMQSRGSKKLAIIDVVITAGNGRKVTSGASYLKAPQRFDDENFPLRGPAEFPKDSEMILPALNDLNSTLRHESVGAEGEIYDQRPKRRAIDLQGLPGYTSPPIQRRSQPQGTGPTVRMSSSLSRTKGARIEKQRPTKLNLAPSATSSLASYQAISPEYGRTNLADFAHVASGSLHGGSLYGSPQSFPSFQSSTSSHAHTPQSQISPYIAQFTSSASRQHSPGIFLPHNASPGLDLVLSPFNHTQSVASSPLFSRCFHPHSLDNDHFSEHRLSRPVFPSSAFQHPPRRNSMGSATMPLSSPATPQAWPGDELYSKLSSQNPNFVPNMLPSSATQSHNTGSRAVGMPIFSPFDRRFSMPLPPTALFSVTTKPKPSTSSRKEARPIKDKTITRAISIRRLIITGKKGVRIVDHTWPATQHIPIHGQATPFLTSGSPTGSRSSVTAPDAAKSGRVGGPLPKKSTTSIEGVPQNQTSVNQNSTFAKDHDDTSSVKESEVVGTHKHEGLVAIDRPREHEAAQTTHSNSAPPEIKPEKTGTSRPPPQRRTASSQGILGIQGPKATAFIFEDPEQLVREAAKEKRKNAPRKPNNSTATGANAPVVLSAAPSATLSTRPPAISSSPLSNMHTIPGLNGASHSYNELATPYTSTTTAETPLPQLDGPSDDPVLSASPLKPESATSSPTKRKPNTKKRKLATFTPTIIRTLEKQPRSPDRLKTISNPPLNEDCVVALAESEDKSVQRGMLRQVRGERQGVFAEEYVVCATRFYVPGN